MQLNFCHNHPKKILEEETMKSTLLALLLLCMLGGCAATYTHPTKSTQDFDRDKQECERIAKKTLVAKGIPQT